MVTEDEVMSLLLAYDEALDTAIEMASRLESLDKFSPSREFDTAVEHTLRAQRHLRECADSLKSE